MLINIAIILGILVIFGVISLKAAGKIFVGCLKIIIWIFLIGAIGIILFFMAIN